jgi:ribonuclease HII
MVVRRNAPVLPKYPTLDYEKDLWVQGFRLVAGLDEAGRGAWAGPVFAAAVVLPNDERVCGILDGVRDSKKMTPNQRERMVGCIRSVSISWGVASSTNEEIDQIGILPATCLAMRRAIDELAYPPMHLLADYITLDECGCPQISLAYGDCLSLSIAAASVLAKVSRDAHMVALGDSNPGYGFARHKGYGTRQHQQALAKLGPSVVHRQSYKPIRALLESGSPV